MAKSALRGRERSAEDAGVALGIPSRTAALPSAAIAETNSRRFIGFGITSPRTLSAYDTHSQVPLFTTNEFDRAFDLHGLRGKAFYPQFDLMAVSSSRVWIALD